MTTLTLSSSEVQNTFGLVIEKSQREIVSVTRHGRIATLIMSPEVLDDYVDARLAMYSAEEGFVSDEETSRFLESIRNA